MSRTKSHDDALVAQFLRLKREVLDNCDRDSSTIEGMAVRNELFRKLCLDLDWAATRLRFSEDEAVDGIIAPVNPLFREEWRDYETRLARPLAGVFLTDLGLALDGAEVFTDAEITDDEARERARAVENIICYLEDKASVADEELESLLNDGLSA